MSFRALLENIQAGRSTKPPTRSRLYATELAVNPLTLSLVLSGKRGAAPITKSTAESLDDLRLFVRLCKILRLAAFAICWQFLLRADSLTEKGTFSKEKLSRNHTFTPN